MKKVINFIKKFIVFTFDKYIKTLSGSLAYFLFMGIIPFCALLFPVMQAVGIQAKLPDFFDIPFFTIINEQVESLSNAKSKAIFFVLLSIYSASHFYFHIISCGEKIYGSGNLRGGIVKRLFSLFYVFIIVFIMILSITAELMQNFIVKYLNLPILISKLIYFVTKLLINFVISYTLHKFSAPKHYIFKDIIKGCLFTLAFWFITGIAFSVYIDYFAVNSKVFISTIIVFLLYLYYLMQGFVYGVALNNYVFNNANG